MRRTTDRCPTRRLDSLQEPLPGDGPRGCTSSRRAGMAHTLGFRLIAVVVLLATAVPWFASPTAGDAAEAPHWVNDLKYGSRGGGFYWDSGSGFVWTAERGWHTFSPVPARSVSPLWVNDLAYPSKGKGFYLDPGTNMVWTAECGWHHFNRDGCPDDGGGRRLLNRCDQLRSVRFAY